ncbi:MAG: T9SS type A sorting domain-containing protein [Flavobacteriales bacterium]|nr:MAG: T9SS type A sorting domain-containing protein [Flavobacteriales bacterium]
MMRTPTLLRTVCSVLTFSALTAAHALQGGPDTYGYTWKDSNEPGGPVYNWFDITQIGTPVTGLADDNVVGPFVMQTNMPFYWYAPKKIWIGSNGYIAFNSVNIASLFPLIPQAGGANDYVACMMADLNFFGAGNPAQCYLYDDVTVTVVSWINVPFWSPLPPSYTGSNTFQVILNKQDSTITVQIQDQQGFTQNNDLSLGIESITGDIGLAHSADQYPVAGHAIRYYNPAVPLLQVPDASVEWNTEETTAGLMLKRYGPDFPLTANYRNTGNVDVGPFATDISVINTLGQVVASSSQGISLLQPGIDTTITYSAAFTPNPAGTYSYRAELSGIPNELVGSNNIRVQELQVYDTTLATINLDWAGPADDGIGIGWNGGNGGVGTHIVPPWYPIYFNATTCRIASNAGLVGFYMRVYDDDGPNGGPGTLLDSVFVPPANATAGDKVIPLANPITLNDGGLYVQWYMGGANINIAQDPQLPISLRSYECLDNVWAEYRDRTLFDFHLGLQAVQPPVYDLGCTGFFGLIDGIDVGSPVSVRAWVKNLGNQTMNNFPMSYQYESDPAVTQNYTGPALAPGDSSLFTFSQMFTPAETETGDICAWPTYAGDADATNDTVCVSINGFVGVNELNAAQLTVMPVPANDRLTILGLPAGDLTLRLVDVNGKVVLEQLLVVNGAVNVDVATLAPGAYSLMLMAADAARTERVVIAR